MAGNRCIADAAVTYVLKRFWSRLAVWGHVEGGIHHQIFCSFPQMFCLVCYGLVKSFFLKNNSFNLCCGGFCGDAE